jgi:hypothetical protein
MSIDKIEISKVIYRESKSSFEVIIPIKRNLSQILILVILFCGWSLGEIFAIKSILNPEDGFSSINIFWIICWTVSGCYFIYMLLNHLFGKEIIIITSSIIRLKKDLLGIGPKKDLDIRNISDIRISPNNIGSNYLDLIDFKTGVIALNYGIKTYRFGNTIDEAEADKILNILISKQVLKDKIKV